jgi:hypothetical protein
MINDCYGLGLPLLMTAILLASAVIDFLCSTKITLAIIRQNLCQSPSLTQSPQQNFQIKAHTKMGRSPKLIASVRDAPLFFFLLPNEEAWNKTTSRTALTLPSTATTTTPTVSVNPRARQRTKAATMAVAVLHRPAFDQSQLNTIPVPEQEQCAVRAR